MSSMLTDFELKWLPVINDYVKREIPLSVPQPLLAESMAYSVNAGGKRMRPLLTLAVLNTFKVDISSSRLRAAAALELLHTYSLIHDDLPAMDDDDLRRNQPTSHVKFGEATAILAGDGLLTLAFQWLTDGDLSDTQKAQLTLELAKDAGPAGMVAGQVDDVTNEGKQLSLTQLQLLHRRKTGALIQDAIAAGLIMADVTQQRRQLFLEFADLFGLAFQIYDDILDVTSTETKLGKPVNQDENKNTYPNLLGLSESKVKLKETIELGKIALAKAGALNNVNVDLLKSFFTYFKLDGDY